jgi:hypothetical protein
VFAFRGFDKALFDQIAQHTPQTLFGDFQDGQKLGDFEAGITADEMQHPVMGAAEPIAFQHRIRLLDEIAVGKEQKFDQVVARRGRIGAKGLGL